LDADSFSADLALAWRSITRELGSPADAAAAAAAAVSQFDKPFVGDWMTSTP